MRLKYIKLFGILPVLISFRTLDLKEKGHRYWTIWLL